MTTEFKGVAHAQTEAVAWPCRFISGLELFNPHLARGFALVVVPGIPPG